MHLLQLVHGCLHIQVGAAMIGRDLAFLRVLFFLFLLFGGLFLGFFFIMLRRINSLCNSSGLLLLFLGLLGATGFLCVLVSLAEWA